MITQVKAIRYQNGKVEELTESVVEEVTVSLYLNGTFFQKLVASAGNLEELGAGFFIAAGLVQKIISVRCDGLNIFVEGEGLHTSDGALESAGGYDPGSVQLPVPSGGQITPEQIFAMRAELNTGDWGETGGLHSSVLYVSGKKAALFSDIGRHNTVDRCIGYMILNNLNPQECVIASTGREPRGMVVKAVHARIPIIVSRAAATSAGIAEAEKNNVTLICFTRDARFTVYAHRERIIFS